MSLLARIRGFTPRRRLFIIAGDMKIYWFKAQAPRRVLALIKHLGIEAETIELDLVRGEHRAAKYAALNPNKKAPLLVDGDLVLPESTAIMAHLCIQRGSDMWPANNPAEQVELLRWLSWNDAHFAPAVGPFYLEHVVKSTFKFGQPDREGLIAKTKDLIKYAKVLDGHLATREYVACNRLTIADFALASMVRYWREAELPLQDFPHLVGWLDRLDELPAWKDPWPESKYTAAHAETIRASGVRSAHTG